jgi:hypothetical protein
VAPEPEDDHLVVATRADRSDERVTITTPKDRFAA